MFVRAAFMAVAAAVLLAGCVPLPRSFYVGDESAGRLSYNSCSLGVIPEGLEVSRACLAETILVLGDGEVVRVVPPTLPELQRQVLDLLAVPDSAYLTSA